jgi:hypothetical protein
MEAQESFKKSKAEATAIPPLLLLKMAVFWMVAPYSLVEIYPHFRGACCLLIRASVTCQQTSTRLHCNNPENGHLGTCCHENLKYHLRNFVFASKDYASGLFQVQNVHCFPGNSKDLSYLLVCIEELVLGFLYLAFYKRNLSSTI